MCVLRSILPVLLAASATLPATACDEREELPPPDQTYTVRGRLEKLPKRERDDMLIHHEAIDGFVDGEGKKVGMKAMVMPFTPAEDLSLDGVQAGEAVRFTFEVRWGGDPMLRVTDLEALPPDTDLEFD
ncbi:MAG: copper-binding protein [Myxococcota bacterium]